jgi:hypothetical protein
MLIDQLRICADCALDSPNEKTYLNAAARPMLKEAADEIERLRAAISLVRGIIVEGAAVGFNPLDGGDWADRLFRSQADTFEALHGKRRAALNIHKHGSEQES